MTFEELRMIDLVEKFKAETAEMRAAQSLGKMPSLSARLQSIYNFHLTADASFICVEDALKNLYSSFNYAALICNEGLKKKSLDREDNQLLAECLQIMLDCCDIVISTLKSGGGKK